MWNITVYLKSHKRQPVHLGALPYTGDPQQALPAGWCSRCGGEIFGRACPACREAREYEKFLKSLSYLHPGAESPGM